MGLDAEVLDSLAPWREARAWQVALSGGLDSTVLLHLLARLAQREALPPLFALHIHHGLQPAADAWPAHCQRLCDALGVPLRIIRVQVAPGASLERAAREARHGAFAEALMLGGVILSAQHCDDQLETLLFRLLRGTGVQGLAGMPLSRPLGRGQLARPLLGVRRAQLLAYAQAHGLEWVEDPSNQDLRFSRNYLRHQVLPPLLARWPQAAELAARTAEHLHEAAGLLDELAQDDLSRAAAQAPWPWLGLPNLSMDVLRSLSEARQRNALRHWLRPLTLMPDTRHWAGWQALRDARADAEPRWQLHGGALLRAAGRLWWCPASWLTAPPGPLPAPLAGQALALPENGSVRIEGALPEGQWQLAYRQGGERISRAGRGSRDLKRIFNEAQVPAFLRARWPLLLCGNEPRALANLPGLDGQGDEWRLIWTPPSQDQGLS
ncbi:MAG: tRNA lysidine(34) synthetase TilS [Gammaproteobacteria bacterium]|nr:tRNA lysidine(34) synthetase TilS [Gammaproteobacteria bacterium]MBU1489534.1 tRNA lysidine(34) synthetase TilS [Gammaproteobacteria bacterium]